MLKFRRGHAALEATQTFRSQGHGNKDVVLTLADITDIGTMEAVLDTAGPCDGQPDILD